MRRGVGEGWLRVQNVEGSGENEWYYALYEAEWTGTRGRGGQDVGEKKFVGAIENHGSWAGNVRFKGSCTQPQVQRDSWQPRVAASVGDQPRQRRWTREWGRLAGISAGRGAGRWAVIGCYLRKKPGI